MTLANISSRHTGGPTIDRLGCVSPAWKGVRMVFLIPILTGLKTVALTMIGSRAATAAATGAAGAAGVAGRRVAERVASRGSNRIAIAEARAAAAEERAGIAESRAAVAEERAEVAELTAIEDRARYKKLLVLVFFVALVVGVVIGWLFVP